MELIVQLTGMQSCPVETDEIRFHCALAQLMEVAFGDDAPISSTLLHQGAVGGCALGAAIVPVTGDALAATLEC